MIMTLRIEASKMENHLQQAVCFTTLLNPKGLPQDHLLQIQHSPKYLLKMTVDVPLQLAANTRTHTHAHKHTHTHARTHLPTRPPARTHTHTHTHTHTQYAHAHSPVINSPGCCQCYNIKYEPTMQKRNTIHTVDKYAYIVSFAVRGEGEHSL